MKSWGQVRTLWLMATLFSCVAVLGKALTKPHAEKPPQPTYDFPQTVPLSGWQFVQGIPIAQHRSIAPGFVTSVDDLAIASQHYRYLRNGKPLNVEMRYFVDSYSSVLDVLKDSTLKNQTQTVTTVESPSGSYALFQRSGKLHLSACIPPNDRTSVTDAEFRGNQLRPPIVAPRIIPWFLGIAPLRDSRCLWANLSISSANPDSADVPRDSEAVRDLEQAWTEWRQWWQKNYPPKP